MLHHGFGIILGEESPNQSATTRSIGAVTRSTPTSTHTYAYTYAHCNTHLCGYWRPPRHLALLHSHGNIHPHDNVHSRAHYKNIHSRAHGNPHRHCNSNARYRYADRCTAQRVSKQRVRANAVASLPAIRCWGSSEGDYVQRPQPNADSGDDLTTGWDYEPYAVPVRPAPCPSGRGHCSKRSAHHHTASATTAKIPGTITPGSLSILTTPNFDLSYRGVNCYYSNVEAALHLTKGQLVSITGKISGEDSYSRIAVFDCEIEGLSLPTLPIVPAQVVRKNTVQVFCTAQSLFGTTGYKGTGVIIDPRAGLILTVHHVIDNDCEKIAVEVPGHAERVPASIDKHCASIDRAQLRIPPQVLTGLRLQPILRAAAPAQKDQEVYFWGFGTGQLRLETGVVTSVSSIWGDSTSTDAHAIPGDSGSPVYNEYGHLLGTMSRSNSSDRSTYTGKQC